MRLVNRLVSKPCARIKKALRCQQGHSRKGRTSPSSWKSLFHSAVSYNYYSFSINCQLSEVAIHSVIPCLIYLSPNSSQHALFHPFCGNGSLKVSVYEIHFASEVTFEMPFKTL